MSPDEREGAALKAYEQEEREMRERIQRRFDVIIGVKVDEVLAMANPVKHEGAA